MPQTIYEFWKRGINVKPYRIKVTVRNHLLLTAIEEQGYKSVAEFERAAGIRIGRINDLVSMRDAPITINGEFSYIAKIVMEVLGAAPTDLWSEKQLTLKLKKNTGERAVDADLIQHLLEQRNTTEILPSPEDALLAAETAQVLDGIIGTLTPREQRVLQIRFHKEGSLEDAAKAFDVTRQRIRQIEAKALRKMRHPDLTKNLIEAGLAKKTHSGGVELDD